MATAGIMGSTLGTPFQDLLMADAIQPGSAPSYQLCKTIYSYHPLGRKIVEAPIDKAQSQKREISVPKGPDRVAEAFSEKWVSVGSDKIIKNVMRQGRMYGAASLAYGQKGVDPSEVIKPQDWAKKPLYFKVFDPLNTAGSLVLNQQPNAPDYQEAQQIVVQGSKYHPSRTCVVFNEEPLYIEYTESAFGFVGRSVYQRILFPLKTFINSMQTDDFVTVKAGLLIAAMKTPGSIVDNIAQTIFGIKRGYLQSGVTGNVLGVGNDDKITSLDLTNTNTAMSTARLNVIKNIASGTPMPAKLMLDESFAEGFGEGSEDAKSIAEYVDGFREEMGPVYQFMDRIVQRLAWTEEFYATIQAEYPEYEGVDYETAFFQWSNSFKAEWPSLLKEPDSELSKVDDVKLKAIIAFVEVAMPALPPDQKAALLQWAADNINNLKMLFQTPLDLDWSAIAAYEPPTALAEPHEPKPESGTT